MRLATVAIVTCGLAGSISGLFLALPVAVLFVIGISLTRPNGKFSGTRTGAPERPQLALGEEVPFTLGERITDAARSATEGTCKVISDPRIPPSSVGPVLVAYTFFFYHWVDRVAYQTLGSRRDTLMDTIREPLVYAIAATLSEGKPAARHAELAEQLESSLDDFQARFAAYRTGADKEEALGGTLFWEFGKFLGGTLGRAGDISVVTVEAGWAAQGIKRMDVSTLLRKVFTPRAGSCAARPKGGNSLLSLLSRPSPACCIGYQCGSPAQLAERNKP